MQVRHFETTEAFMTEIFAPAYPLEMTGHSDEITLHLGILDWYENPKND